VEWVTDLSRVTKAELLREVIHQKGRSNPRALLQETEVGGGLFSLEDRGNIWLRNFWDLSELFGVPSRCENLHSNCAGLFSALHALRRQPTCQNEFMP
jgi:hypothetical protein